MTLQYIRLSSSCIHTIDTILRKTVMTLQYTRLSSSCIHSKLLIYVSSSFSMESAWYKGPHRLNNLNYFNLYEPQHCQCALLLAHVIQ